MKKYACLIFACLLTISFLGCKANEEIPAQLGTIEQSAPKPDDSIASPSDEGVVLDPENTGETATDPAQDTPSQTAPETSDEPIETPDPNKRGAGVPHTTRTQADLEYNKDISGKIHGIVTATNKADNDIWYVTIKEVEKREGAPAVDASGQEHRTLDAVPTGQELTFCVSKTCFINVETPYAQSAQGTIGNTMADIDAAKSLTTTYGEPYYFELVINRGVAYDITLWKAFYANQLYRHGLAGVVTNDPTDPTGTELVPDAGSNGDIAQGQPTAGNILEPTA